MIVEIWLKKKDMVGQLNIYVCDRLEVDGSEKSELSLLFSPKGDRDRLIIHSDLGVISATGTLELRKK